MTKEYEDLIQTYVQRITLYLEENKYEKKKAQNYQFWLCYIKYWIDTNYSSLAGDVFKKLVKDKL